MEYKTLFCFSFIILFFNCYAQNNYIPPQRDGVSDASYEKWVSRIQSLRNRIKDKSISTKQRIVLEYNIAHGYKALKEPPDSLFDRLYSIIKLDTVSVCYEIIDWNNAFKNFGKESYEELSPVKWKKLYQFCKPHAKQLEEEYEKLKKEAEQNINHILLKQLNLLLERDGKYRSLIEEKEQQYGINSQEVKDLWQKQHQLDSINCILVDSIITQYNGYVGVEITGEYHNNDLLLIALHSNSLDFLDKHYPMFARLVKENMVNKDLFMILTDRYHLQKNGKQVFGTQTKWNEAEQLMKKAPMYSEEKLIQLKEELGFKHH